MRRGPDASDTLPESTACQIVDVAPAKRRDWVRAGVLDQPLKAARLNELQTAELAVVRELHDVLGARDARIVWRQVREEVRARVQTPQLDLVVDVAYREVQVVTSDEELAAAARTTRAIRVIELAPLIRRVRDAVRRITSASDNEAESSCRPRSSKTANRSELNGDGV